MGKTPTRENETSFRKKVQRILCKKGLVCSLLILPNKKKEDFHE